MQEVTIENMEAQHLIFTLRICISVSCSIMPESLGPHGL